MAVDRARRVVALAQASAVQSQSTVSRFQFKTSHVVGLTRRKFSFSLSVVCHQCCWQWNWYSFLTKTRHSLTTLLFPYYDDVEEKILISVSHLLHVLPGDASDIELVRLALHTLGEFDFSGIVLTEFVRDSLVVYLDDDDTSIRVEAALTCSKLLAQVRQDIKHTHTHSLLFSKINIK